MHYTFEDKYSEIIQEIKKREAKWQLSYPAFEDVTQMLLIHIWKKWNYWDQNTSFESWLNFIIGFQIRAYNCYYGLKSKHEFIAR